MVSDDHSRDRAGETEDKTIDPRDDSTQPMNVQARAPAIDTTTDASDADDTTTWSWGGSAEGRAGRGRDRRLAARNACTTRGVVERRPGRHGNPHCVFRGCAFARSVDRPEFLVAANAPRTDRAIVRSRRTTPSRRGTLESFIGPGRGE